ncbi:MAG: hypothetical protein QXS20_10215 [Candidatus Thorarchaeota archaeon]
MQWCRVASLLVSVRQVARSALVDSPRSRSLVKALVTGVLLLDLFIVLFVLAVMVIRQSSAGLGMLDSIPLALYVLPLTIIIPSLSRACYRLQNGLLFILIMLLASVVLLTVSVLVRLLLLVSLLNVISAILVSLVAELKPRGSLRSVGRRGLVWLVILNLVGLMFPASVYLMGQNPITTVRGGPPAHISLEVPLAPFSPQTVPVPPDAQLVNGIEDGDFGVTLWVLAQSDESMALLRGWIASLRSTEVPVVIVISADREAHLSPVPDTLGSTETTILILSEIGEAIGDVVTILSEEGMPADRLSILLDLTLSDSEFEVLMSRVRSIDLFGFASLFRASLERVDLTMVAPVLDSVVEEARSAGLRIGARVEGYVIDDALDSDALFMLTCGLDLNMLSRLDLVELDCQRYRYSMHMAGDVGEYLVHSYSRTAAISPLGVPWTLRLGVVDTDAYDDCCLYSLASLVSDIVIAGANGVQRVTVSSLDGLTAGPGVDGVTMLRAALNAAGPQDITYTFRIYAFRSILMALDTLDPVML